MNNFFQDLINTTGFSIARNIFAILGVVGTILTIIVSGIQIHKWVYDSEKSAFEYYKIGEKYYEEKEYKTAAEYFEKTYNINKNLLNVKYYYVMSLLNVDMELNTELAKRVFNS